MGTIATCGTTTAKGLHANSFFVLIHYVFRASGLQAQSVFVPSTSTTGSNRRVPPPRGLPPRQPPSGIPFVRV